MVPLLEVLWLNESPLHRQGMPHWKLGSFAGNLGMLLDDLSR